MAKTTDDTTPAPVTPKTFPLTIEEFCTELSKTDKRPEMIYAFSKDEMRNGRVRDTAENFQSRYVAFGARVPA